MKRRSAMSQCLLAVLPEVQRVGGAGVHAHDRGLDAGDRRDHLGDVAVGDHELRVRVHRVERVDAEHVRGRLQPPAVRRAVPLQQLQHALVVAVRRAVVAVASATSPYEGVCATTSSCAAPEREVHELEALGRAVGRRRQHRLQLRRACRRGPASSPGRRGTAGRWPRSRARAAASAATPPTAAGCAPPGPGRGGSSARSTRCGGGRARTAPTRSAGRRSPGASAYHCSICRRRVSSEPIMPANTISPCSLSAASSLAERTSTSSASCIASASGP